MPTRADRGIEYYDIPTEKYEICGKGGNPINCGITVQKTLFSPRVGLAYRVRPDSVVRAGYSINPEQINMYRDGVGSYPVSTLGQLLRSELVLSGESHWSGIPVLTPVDVSSGVVPLPAGVTFVTAPKNFVRGYVESYNLTVEHDFGKSWIAQAGYVGSHTVHQHTRYNINYGLPGGGAASQPFFNGTLRDGNHGRRDGHLSLRANELQLAADNIATPVQRRIYGPCGLHMVKVDGDVL